MQTLFSVNYFENDKLNHKYFEKKRDAINLAKKSSVGRRASVYRCNGLYNNETFYEVESVLVAIYINGVKQ